MTYKHVITQIEAAGWRYVRMGKGGHMIFSKFGAPRPIVISGGGKLNRDVPAGTLAAILRQAGLR